METKTNISKKVWDNLTGDVADFSMENRAFNYVSIISFLILIYCLAYDIYLSLAVMSVAIVILMAVLAVLYYFSRFKKKYHTGIVVFAICNYAILILNYYYYYWILNFLVLVYKFFVVYIM